MTATPVASPFLPDTNIQFAWDSTSIGDLKTCPRKYYLTMIEGWSAKDNNVHLRFGGEFHEAIQDYEKAKAAGETHEDAIRTAVRALLIRIHDWKVDERTKAGNYKNPRTLIQLCIDYFDHYAEDPAETFILDNGAPAVELSFRFELPWGPEAAPEQNYLLCGHLDRVVKFGEDLFVLDHKTSTTTPSDYFFKGFNPSNQMTLYTLAGKIVLDAPIRGVIIEASQIMLQEPSRFVRKPTHRTQDQLDEWVADLRYWLSLAEHYATSDHWPMNDTACTMYGGCKFQDICGKSPQVREIYLRNDFTQLPKEERWNPLKPR